MKAFLITWGLFCFLVVVGLFIAYATDNLPGVPSPKQVGLETDECSPCEDNIKRLKQAMEQLQKAGATFDHERTDDNREQLKKALETLDSAIIPLEREKNKAAEESGQSPNDSP